MCSLVNSILFLIPGAAIFFSSARISSTRSSVSVRGAKAFSLLMGMAAFMLPLGTGATASWSIFWICSNLCDISLCASPTRSIFLVSSSICSVFSFPSLVTVSSFCASPFALSSNSFTLLPSFSPCEESVCTSWVIESTSLSCLSNWLVKLVITSPMTARALSYSSLTLLTRVK